MPGSESADRVGPESGPVGWRRELESLDVAVYAAIAASPTPTFDRAFGALSRAADHSKLWFGVAALLSATRGELGYRAAVSGLASVAVTSAVVNVALKPLGGRRRPDRVAHEVPVARHVAMPRSTSFPSGHAASAFAFATGVAHAYPAAGVPIRAAAALVAYSRVHTGVHYPGDVLAGALSGTVLARLTAHAIER
jgi:membrane-associated phospholipid phosphatase